MQDYVTGIKLMLPLVFLNLMLLGILIGQNVPPHQVIIFLTLTRPIGLPPRAPVAQKIAD